MGAAGQLWTGARVVLLYLSLQPNNINIYLYDLTITILFL